MGEVEGFPCSWEIRIISRNLFEEIANQLQKINNVYLTRAQKELHVPIQRQDLDLNLYLSNSRAWTIQNINLL